MAIEANINYMAVIVSAAANFLLGWLWYSPMLFGKQWMKMMGFDKLSKAQQADMKKKMGVSIFMGIVTSFVIAYILAHFVAYTGSTTIGMGMQTGFWIWLGFIATTMMGTVLWEGKPWKLYFINVGYYLVSFHIMGAILAAWK